MASARIGRVGIALVWIAACTTHVTPATPTPRDAAASPTASPAATTSTAPEPTATLDLIHYSSDGLSFEYPSDWRLIAQGDSRIGQHTMVVVGTGDWRSACPDMTICAGEDVFEADPGEVVAHFSYFYSGPAFLAYETPPFDARRLASGLAAIVEDEPQATLATMFVPGHRSLKVDVRFGSPPSEPQRAAVVRMIESMDLAGGNSPYVETATPPAAPECSATSFRGQLARGDLGGLNLAMPDVTWARVFWPNGWSARLGDDRRAELFDGSGEFVAREWDEVEVGGQGDANEFQACADAVEVIQSFPTSTE